MARIEKEKESRFRILSGFGRIRQPSSRTLCSHHENSSATCTPSIPNIPYCFLASSSSFLLFSMDPSQTPIHAGILSPCSRCPARRHIRAVYHPWHLSRCTVRSPCWIERQRGASPVSHLKPMMICKGTLLIIATVSTVSTAPYLGSPWRIKEQSSLPVTLLQFFSYKGCVQNRIASAVSSILVGS